MIAILRHWRGPLVACGLLATAACGGDDAARNPNAPGGVATVGTVTLTVTPGTTLPTQGGDVELTATVSTSGGQPGGGVPVTFTTTSGSFNASTVTTDQAGQAKARLTTRATATVRAAAASATSADIVITVKPFATIQITTDPAQPEAGAVTRILVASRRQGADVSGRLTVSFGDGATTTVNTAGQAAVEHTYAQAGGVNVSAVLDESDGSQTRETIRLEIREGQRRGQVGGGGGDDIDARNVRYLHRNVADWPITSQITSVTIRPGEICVDHTGAGRFPTSRFGTIDVEGNVWVFARFGGQWYAGTYDWLRPGQVCKAVSGDELGVDQIRIPPMDASWRPRSGDQIGFMVSTRARDDVRAGEERTNIKVITWP